MSDGSSSATPVDSGGSTPRLCRRDASVEELSMTTWMTKMNALAPLSSDALARQDEAAAVINWPAVAVGVTLSQAALSGRESMDPAVARTMLIDSLKYMVGALPNDLSEREVDMLNGFLPASALHADGLNLLGQTGTSLGSANILRWSRARLVCFVVSLFALILPVFAFLVERALVCERQYHLTERMVHGTGQVARNAGLATLLAGDKLLHLGQSSVGRQCLNFATWIFQSIAEGVTDGIDHTVKQRRVNL